jgi:uncharacterized protein
MKIVQVFTKAPVMGQVKTRLIPHYGEVQATLIYQALLWSQLERIMSEEWTVELWCTPDDQHPFLQQCAAHFNIQTQVQQGEDLGQRMTYALSNTGGSATLLIGCDCPTIDNALILQGFNALEQAQLVFSPAEDGGFVLVGATKMPADLFTAMRWGQADVMTTIRQRLRHQGLIGSELPTQWDVDYPEDVQRWQREFGGN